jgi:hypothetical protein
MAGNCPSSHSDAEGPEGPKSQRSRRSRRDAFGRCLWHMPLALPQCDGLVLFGILALETNYPATITLSSVEGRLLRSGIQIPIEPLLTAFTAEIRIGDHSSSNAASSLAHSPIFHDLSARGRGRQSSSTSHHRRCHTEYNSKPRRVLTGA